MFRRRALTMLKPRHRADGTHRLEEPVSKITVNGCGGVPSEMSPKYCAFMKSRRPTLGSGRWLLSPLPLFSLIRRSDIAESVKSSSGELRIPCRARVRWIRMACTPVRARAAADNSGSSGRAGADEGASRRNAASNKEKKSRAIAVAAVPYSRMRRTARRGGASSSGAPSSDGNMETRVLISRLVGGLSCPTAA